MKEEGGIAKIHDMNETESSDEKIKISLGN